MKQNPELYKGHKKKEKWHYMTIIKASQKFGYIRLHPQFQNIEVRLE